MSPAGGNPSLDNRDAAIEADYLKHVLAAVPAFVVRLDAEHRIRYINRLQPGFTMEEVLGRPAYEFVEPASHAQLRVAIEQALCTGLAQRYLSEGAGADGATAHYDTRVVPVPEADGSVGIVLIALEVTEHIARAEALRASEQKLRVAIEATGLGLWTWDLDSGRVDWSPRMREMLGVEQPLELAEYIDTLVHPADRKWLAESLRQGMSAGVPRFPAHRIIRPDGETRWMMPSGTSVTDAGGRRRMMLGGMLDVTEEQRIEERLRQAKKMEAVAELTAGVAHNFNNMLAVIQPALELTLGDVAPTRRHIVGDALDAARRAAALVKGLMAFAGRNRGAERAYTDVAALVRSAAGEAERLLAPCVVELGELPEGLSVECDRRAIAQALINLLLNARDASAGPPCAPVELSVDTVRVRPPDSSGPEAPYVRIAVRDHGTGIDPAVAERMFEPFFTTKEPGKGTGLGLATCYAIVQEHGGFLGFESELGRGSLFCVHLPASEAAAAKPPPAREGGREAEPASQLSGGHILVIDDEEAIRTVIAHFLTDDGFSVACARDVPSALAELERGPKPQVVLLDRSMPGAPGTTAVPEIRRRAPDAALLYFTGQDVTPEERAMVDGVVAKPVAAQELLAIIRSHL